MSHITSGGNVAHDKNNKDSANANNAPGSTKGNFQKLIFCLGFFLIYGMKI